MVMCRLLVLLSKPRNENQFLEKIIDYFVKASVNDVYIKGRGHRDGWGFVCLAYSESTGKPVVLSFKTLSPIDSIYSKSILNRFVEKVSVYDEVYLMIHSRLGGLTEPYGEEHVHPYFFKGKNHLLWFIHNGGVDKFRLSEFVGENPLLHTDSWFTAAYISFKMNNCSSGVDECVVSIYSDLAEYISKNSSLNTGLLILQNGEHHLYVSYIPRAEAASNVYYALYQYVGETNIAVFSSTIHYYMVQEDKRYVDNVKQLKPGVYKLSFKNKITKLS